MFIFIKERLASATQIRRPLGALLFALACSCAPAPAPAPKAYIGLFGDSAVAVFDTGTNQVLRTIAIPQGPHGLVVTPDGRKVYVSSDGDSKVTVISTLTDQVTSSIEVGKSPHGLTISPDGSQVVVSAYGTDRVIIIDTARDQIAGQVLVPKPHNSAISRDGKTAYVGSQQLPAPGLYVVDLVNLTASAPVALPMNPRAFVMSPLQQVYFTESGVDAVEVFDPASASVAAKIPTGPSPHSVVAVPGQQLALVGSQVNGDLEFIDPASNTITATVQVGKLPHWIDVTGDGARALVTGEASGDLSVVDVAGRKLVVIVPVGNAPRKVAVQPVVPADASPRTGAAPAKGY